MSDKEQLKFIVKRLQKAMEDSGMSYGEISLSTGIPKSAVHRYISGQTPKIPIERLAKISNAMGVSLSYIMDWDDNLPPLSDNLELPNQTITIYSMEGTPGPKTLEIDNTSLKYIVKLIEIVKNLPVEKIKILLETAKAMK